VAQAAKPATPVHVVRIGQLVPTFDNFNERLQDPAFWAARRSSNVAPQWTGKSFLGLPTTTFQLPPIVEARPRRVFSETYRTVCVRLCDGSFVPVSFATTRDKFDNDAAKCENSCQGGGTRLFVYRNPGEEPENMEDLNGNPYRGLPTAFLYKTKYDESCKCRPHPWEEASRNQHRIYALEAQRGNGNRAVSEELKTLREQVRSAEAAVIDARRAAELKKQAEQRRRAAEAKAAEEERIATRKRERAEAKAAAAEREARLKQERAEARAAKARDGKPAATIAVATTAPPGAASSPPASAVTVPDGTPTGTIRVMRGNRSTNDVPLTEVTHPSGGVATGTGPLIVRVPPAVIP
jgi:hypothetical protein